ncbi:MAG: hypothetical protein IRY95_10025 [Clostridia bacterium]|nr:hypothetical protein [Clostridia bacterium]
MERLDLQFYAFCVMWLTGAVAGFLFDLLRLARGALAPVRWLRDVVDLVFWIPAGLLVILGFFLSSWGLVRNFAFLGLAAGAACYFLLASPVTAGVIAGLCRVGAVLGRRGVALVRRPARTAARRLRRLWPDWSDVRRWLRRLPGFF